jgi:hypothetical protein
MKTGYILPKIKKYVRREMLKVAKFEAGDTDTVCLTGTGLDNLIRCEFLLNKLEKEQRKNRNLRKKLEEWKKYYPIL